MHQGGDEGFGSPRELVASTDALYRALVGSVSRGSWTRSTPPVLDAQVPEPEAEDHGDSRHGYLRALGLREERHSGHGGEQQETPRHDQNPSEHPLPHRSHHASRDHREAGTSPVG